jgi:hypothetical protein
MEVQMMKKEPAKNKTVSIKISHFCRQATIPRTGLCGKVDVIASTGTVATV